MKRLNLLIRNALGFSKSEANGLLILLPLTFLIVASPFIYRNFIYTPRQNQFDYEKMEELRSSIESKIVDDSVERAKKWKEYFNKKSFKSEFKENIDWSKRRFESSDKFTYSPKNKLVPFDINLADTTEFKKLKGIGTTLASRIIKYRNWLGGFTSKSQLKEVYGLSEEVLQGLDSMTFIVADYKPLQMDVNTMSEADLKKHPYISYNTAKAIDAYKFQHGSISSIEDLKKIKLIDTITLQKLLPYLKWSSVKD